MSSTAAAGWPALSPTASHAWRRFAALALGIAAGAWVAPGAQAAPPVAEQGAAIYLKGRTVSGAALEARRDDAPTLRGTQAACVNCHQRSGFGTVEGRNIVPPVTGRYLYRPRTKEGDDRDIPFVETMRGDREPYTDETLAHAIREGLDSQGKPMSYLMPQYALNDADMAALIGYLKKLDKPRMPGVTDSTLHFATIVTPDADPVKRAAMLEVMRQFFADRNVRQMVPAPHLRTSSRTAYSGSMFKVQRRWELHVWELSGPASGWAQQLERRLASEPVLAVLSGLGGSTWAPVHEFCERAQLPCLFPNVEAPPSDADASFYSTYFSRGVLLEAGLAAKGLLDKDPAPQARRVLQVLRAGDIGEAGAAVFEAALRDSGAQFERRVIARDAPVAAVAASLAGAEQADALLLWLRPTDLAALPEAPPAGPAIYLSGLMAGLEHAPLPAPWRNTAHMTYPFDLPDRRRVRVDYGLGWMRARHIDVVDEQVQTDTYLACGLVSETLAHMVDTFVRDYLVERVQDMLAHRIVTGYYPRLSLSTGQRFASKGGHLVRFAQPQGLRLTPESDWIVP